jgi:hypothetical protein
MLKCKDIANVASDYLDGSLDWKKLFFVKLHLFICVNCKRFVRHLLTTIRYIGGMKRQTATSAETGRILALLPEQDKNKQ